MSDYPLSNLPDHVILHDDPRMVVRPVTCYAAALRGKPWHPANTEEAARYSASTHKVCPDCKTIATDKYRTRCRSCQRLADIKEWEALPRVEWDGKTPIVEIDGDTWIMNEFALESWLDDIEDLDGITPLFVLGVPVKWHLIDVGNIIENTGCFDDDTYPELPEGVAELIDQANRLLKDNPPGLWGMLTRKRCTAVSIEPWIKAAIEQRAIDNR